MIFRWTTVKGLAAIVAFLVVVALIELAVVLYAMSLGIADPSFSKTSFLFPGTSYSVTIGISPLFHLVPLSVLIVLGFSWSYLAKRVAFRAPETRKSGADVWARRGTKQQQKAKPSVPVPKQGLWGRVKAGFLRVRGVSYVWQRISFAKATIKSALVVLLVFIVFIVVFVLFAYPQLIFDSVRNAYQTNSGLLNFVRSVDSAFSGFGQTVSPIGFVAGAINGAFITISPGIRSIGLGLGEIISPIAALDGPGKYLVFQNAAAWFAVVVSLLYGHTRRPIRYLKK